jgi:hypothetical protein
MVKKTLFINSNRRPIHVNDRNGAFEFYVTNNNEVTWRKLPNSTNVHVNNSGRLHKWGNVEKLKAFYHRARNAAIAARTPVTGVAKKAGLKWLMGPARNVILPKNNTIKAPINLSFNRGNYAIRYTKRWMRNGNNKSVRLYYSVPIFERLANQKWSDIFRYPGSEIVMHHSPHLKSDKTRVYRRNLALVRFV